MKRILILFAAALLSACVSNTAPKDGEPVGVVVTTTSYQEISPFESTFGRRKGIMSQKYLTAAMFKNTATGEERMVGIRALYGYGHVQPQLPDYEHSMLEAGHYELDSFFFAGVKTKYDGDKCGAIGFDVVENDAIFLKGIVPQVIGDPQGLAVIGGKRQVKYIKFQSAPSGYKEYMNNVRAGSKTLKFISPTSDNPQAFQACVDAVQPKYDTLSKEKGSFVVPAK